MIGFITGLGCVIISPIFTPHLVSREMLHRLSALPVRVLVQAMYVYATINNDAFPCVPFAPLQFRQCRNNHSHSHPRHAR